MKRIIYLLGLTIVMFGCLEEQWDAGDGGKSVANLNPPTKVAFLFGETTAIDIDLAPFVSGSNVISTYVVTKTLTAGGVSSDPVTYTLTTPTFSQTVAELLGDVPINDTVLTDAELSPGDKWVLSYSFTLDNGDEYNVGYDTDIPFSCPSNIPEGNYDGETVEGAFGVFSTNSMTLTKLDASGNYSTTDLTAGFYPAFGFNLNQPGTINDLCNVINITGNAGSQFDLQPDPDEVGSWDPITEVLSIPWYDAGNDFEDLSVYTYNP